MRILLVEDVATDAELMLRELKRAGILCNGHRVETAVDFRRELEEFQPHVILSDFSMPNFDGMEALRIASQSYSHIPFIFVSGTLGEEYAVRALKNGATDFVLKTDLLRLPPSVERAIKETEERRARQVLEQQVHESEERFRQLAENIHEVFWVHAVDSEQSLYISPAYERVWGSPRGDVQKVHRDWVESIYPEDRAQIRKSLEEMTTGVKALDVEYRIVRPDGSLRWIHDRGFPVRDAQGKIYRTAGIAEDITERMRLKVTLQEQAAGLQRAQLLAKLGHVITGPGGSFVRWSETLPQLIGVTPAEMPQSTRAWLDILHVDDREKFRRKSIEAAVTGARVDIDYRLWRADGELIHVRQVIEPLEGQSGERNSLMWFCTIQDVTEQTRAEERIKRLNRVHTVRIRDREELFQEACRIAVDQGGFTVGWISVLDHASGKLVPVAKAGLPLDLEAGGESTDRSAGFAPAGTAAVALREKRPAFDNDIERDPGVMSVELAPDTLSVRRAAIQMGAKSVIVLPLFVEGQTFGILTLYAPERHFFDDEEIKLLTELAGDISFGLEYIAKDEKVDYLAYYDPLTGLPNRTLFSERLGQQLHTRADIPELVAVALIDVERLRLVNDTLSRQAGDELLRLIARRLESNATTTRCSNPARVVADCFGVIIRGARDANELAQLVEEGMKACFGAPFVINGQELRIDARAGVSAYPTDGSTAESLLHNAEAALRKAKQAKERFVFYAPEMTARVAEFLVLETKLRKAIDLEQFVLHYQPKFDAATGKPTGVEALIRWNDPDTGMVPPLRFIQILEETGMIFEVGRWALRQALADQQRWRGRGLPVPRVAVNVSAQQLRDQHFVQDVQFALASQEGLKPALELEITESLLMEDIERNIERLKTLRGLGVSIAIDDFGTGYSSLNYLARLPMDTLKIDRSFVVGMAQSPESRTIVSTIISLAHSLGLKVVAEGVETEEQLHLLRLLKCDEMQGFLLSRPVAFDEMASFLSR
ncbi:MAG: EAL domain-containing protein [Betaproteobacteria bacterium]|nr:EAL domain-containing protein [Betaproteobacteria bacterium]